MGKLLGGGSGGKVAAVDSETVRMQRAGMKVGEGSAEALYDRAGTIAEDADYATDFAQQAGLRAYNQSQDLDSWLTGERGRATRMADSAVRDAEEFDDVGFRERYAQRAGEDVTAGAGRAMGMMNRQAAGLGLRPGSGAFADMMLRGNLATAMGSAQATNMAREAARLEGIKLTDRASGLLQRNAATFAPLGLQSMQGGITAGMSPLTATGYGAQVGNMGFNDASRAGLGLAGAGTAQYNANAKFNADKAKAEQSKGSPLGSMLGMAAGAFGTAFGGPVGGMLAKAAVGAMTGGGDKGGGKMLPQEDFGGM